MQKTLHIITKNSIPSILTGAIANSGIIMTQDAVYLLLNQLPSSWQEVYVLQDDFDARINNATVLSSHTNIKKVDYTKFVELCCQFDKSITW